MDWLSGLDGPDRVSLMIISWVVVALVVAAVAADDREVRLLSLCMLVPTGILLAAILT